MPAHFNVPTRCECACTAHAGDEYIRRRERVTIIIIIIIIIIFRAGIRSKNKDSDILSTKYRKTAHGVLFNVLYL